MPREPTDGSQPPLDGSLLYTAEVFDTDPRGGANTSEHEYYEPVSKVAHESLLCAPGQPLVRFSPIEFLLLPA